MGRQSIYLPTPKLVVLVKLQATRSSQFFVEKGVLVVSAIKRSKFNHKLVHTTRSWYSMHQIPFLSKTKQNEKQSPPTSFQDLPALTNSNLEPSAHNDLSLHILSTWCRYKLLFTNYNIFVPRPPNYGML
jgi:hypothetical protein